jgi:hypothetical protein
LVYFFGRFLAFCYLLTNCYKNVSELDVQKLVYISMVVVFVLGLVTISNEACHVHAGEERVEVNLSVSANFMSKYVVRGVKVRNSIFMPTAEVVVGSLTDGVDFYCGVVGVVSVEDRHEDASGVSFISGVRYRNGDGLIFDVGGTYFRVLHVLPLKDVFGSGLWSHGFYVGVAADAVFRPSLYCFYGSYGNEISLEGRVEYDWSLAGLGLYNFMFGFAGEIGYNYVGKPWGLPYADCLGSKGYLYYGIASHLIYRFGTGAKARMGVSYEGNAASKNSWVNGCRERRNRNNIWFNVSFDFEF